MLATNSQHRSQHVHSKVFATWEKVFWKVFMRSCGLPTRSVGPTSRSARLLLGRTYLSGTAVSLVGGDLGVPMSHKLLSEV
jgi:hypothetical protein